MTIYYVDSTVGTRDEYYGGIDIKWNSIREFYDSKPARQFAKEFFAKTKSVNGVRVDRMKGRKGYEEMQTVFTLFKN